MPVFFHWLVAMIVLWSVAAASVGAQDTTLGEVLIDGEDWELVADGFKFTEGPAVDAQGTLYFADVLANKILRLGSTGVPEVFVPNSSATNGLMFGPDGRLYGCQTGKKRIVAYDRQGNATEIFRGAVPNDLVVTRAGAVYYTDPDEKVVGYVSPQGAGKIVDRGIGRPNGIALWPGQGTLVVSDTTGVHVWTFRIEADGSLAHKESFYTMLTPPDHNASGADGMTVDTQGRLYVATYLGVQVFDAQGRLAGVIAKPTSAFLSNVKFAGPKLDTLYATCTDKVFCRKTKVTGVRYFDPPAAK